MNEPVRSPRWLITGAHGFLGANLGAFLEGQADRVGLVRVSEGSGPYDSWIHSDLAHTDQLRSVVAATNPDVAIHAAAMASHEQCEREPDLARLINVTATRELAAATAAAGSRFVLISTDAVFDGERGNYSETDSPNPHSVYGRTKLEGEQAALEACPEALIIRTNFFGWSPTGRRSILEFFVSNLAAGTPVRGFTDFTVSSLYAQSLAEAIWDLVQRRKSGIFHVAASDALTKYEFGLAVAQEFGLDEGLITPTLSDMDPPRGQDQSLNVSKAEAALERRLSSTAEGIASAHAADTLRQRLLQGQHP